ncbi:MAG: hypothetical protein Q8L27_00250 [archaeon]|nr:hypothetical protein [archaeon]
MPRYAILTSDVPDQVLEYLKRKGLTIKTHSFNPNLDLSSIAHSKMNNGWQSWKQCDKFIEGLEWEDHRIKPKNPEEAQNGGLSSHLACDRGWTKFRCESAVTLENKRGVINSSSWIHCNYCTSYSPRTLEGRRDVLIAIRNQYEREAKEISRQINVVEAEFKKQTQPENNS